MEKKFSDGITWGSILITVKSSVGIVNMPESTARLMILMKHQKDLRSICDVPDRHACHYMDSL